jgi:2-methylisocitrate lyase-like PEP mutase family enzyme
MTTQGDLATLFAGLHVPGNPLILFNVWDAGSAKAIAETGAQAIATGSAAVAAAHGFGDRELLPPELALANLRRIVESVSLPVTFDMEGGYGTTADAVGEMAAQAIAAGAVGVNFEDQIVSGDGLYSSEEQAARIAAVRHAAEAAGVALFINARTDIFLKAPVASHNDEHLAEALRRADIYAASGASGFFAAGLANAVLIEQLCQRAPLPINIMVTTHTPPLKELAALGVARISHGGLPYRNAMEALREGGRRALALEG